MPKKYHSDSEELSLGDFDSQDESLSPDDSTEGKKKSKRKASTPKKVRKNAKSPKKINKKKGRVSSSNARALKKPISAFAAYKNATISGVKNDNPELALSEINKKIADLWKTLSSSEKESYIKQALEDKKRFDSEAANYSPSEDFDDYDDDEDEDEVDENDDYDDDEEEYERKKFPRKKRSKREKKDPNAPKRPLNAYLIFVNKERPETIAQNPGWKITEVVQYLGNRWKNLDDEQKKPYSDLAYQDKIRFQKEMKDYDAKL